MKLSGSILAEDQESQANLRTHGPLSYGIVEEDAPHDESRTSTWDHFQAKGVKAATRLEEAITNNERDKIYRPWDEKYKEEFNMYSKPIAESLFTDLGLNSYALWRTVALQSKSTTAHLDTVWGCSFSTAQKAILASWSIRQADENQGEDRLPWSELTFQRWKGMAGAGVADLKWVLRQGVVNPDTVSIMTEAHARLLYSESGHAVFNPSKENPTMKEAFSALAGTDNGKGVFYMLADHHRELRNLRVVKIHTWPAANGRPPSMALELGRT